MLKSDFVLIRGGGDLASGVALRLLRSGIQVLITELPTPLAVRRTVSFSDTVYEGMHSVEGVKARLIEVDQFSAWEEPETIPVVIDPIASILSRFEFPVVVDARLLKLAPDPLPHPVPLHIGLGPGFIVGRDCHAVIETRRSHTLGRTYWFGSTQSDSGEPEGDPRRVLRASRDGKLKTFAQIGDHLRENQPIAEILTFGENQPITVSSPFAGVLHGLLRDGAEVRKGLKIGDVDVRDDVSACFLVSDKSLAIGGGVLEAVLTRADIRERLYGIRSSR